MVPPIGYTAEGTPVSARGARISGIGGYRPARLVTNEEIMSEAAITAEWIESRTGIRTRHRAADHESIAMMAAAAGNAALSDAKVRPQDVGLVIVASTTQRRPVPNVAPQVADLMGCPSAGAFDINAACAGFAYALHLAGVIRQGDARHVVIACADRFVDWTSAAVTDTYATLGDGAGAAVVSSADRDDIARCVWGSDGRKHAAIEIPDGAVEVRMNGPLVYSWAVSLLPGVGRAACAAAGVAAADLAWLVMHQANRRLLDAVGAALGIPRERIACDVVDTGNTSSASIPLALSRLRDERRIHADDLVLLLGFGAGLTYAGQVVRMSG